MDFRLAEKSDLPGLNALFRALVAHMERENLQIWNEIYPSMCFCGDIEQKRLYLLTEQDEIAAAFALCGENAGAEQVKWENPRANALYLDRLGVNPAFLRQGVGRAALSGAISRAKALGADYLRLFVVDHNQPAVNLYRKCGFRRAGGVFHEKIDDGLVLHELGFEIKSGELPPG